MNSTLRSTARKSVLFCCVAALAVGLLACGGEDPQDERDWDADDYELVVEQSTDGGLSPLEVDFEAVVDGPDSEEVTVHWQFGDLGEAEGTDVGFTFEEAGNHTIEAIAERDEYTVGGAETSVIVDDFDIEATAEPTEGVEPVTVDFDCKTDKGEPVEYNWEFGDGEQTDNPAPTYTYTDAGTYVATCTAIGRSGARLVDSVEIDVEAATSPDIAIAASPTSGAAPLDVEFDATVQGGHEPYNYEWQLGDDSDVVDDATFTHTYDQAGGYTVVLTVTDDLGNAAVDSTTIDVDPTPGPEVVVSASPEGGTAPLDVDFDATVESGEPPYAYDWNLGDGTDGVDDESPSHTYEQPGAYTAELTVTDDNGNTDTDSVTIGVDSPGAPDVAVVASPPQGTAPLDVDFDATVQGGEQPYDYQWDLGDGSDPVDDQSFTHTYDEPGIYTAVLTVTDELGEAAVESTTVTVEAVADPTVTASATPEGGTAPLEVDLDSTIEGGQPPYDVEWDPGDGSSTVDGQSLTHTYDQAGIFTATVAVTDDLNNTSTDTVTVEVDAPDAPDVVVSADPISGTAPLEVDFDSTVDGGQSPYDYQWDPGDGSETVTDSSFTHTYDDPGTYTAVLVVTDDFGSTAVESVAVHVDPAEGPDVSVSALPQTGEAPLEVDFDANVQDGEEPYSYEWDLDDGSDTVTDSSFTHTYEDEGIYTPTLTVTDDLGNTDSDAIAVSVDAAPPVAIAELVDDSDECILPGDDVPVDASDSYSPADKTLTFDWSFVSSPVGSTAEFVDDNSAETVLNTDEAGTYEFRVFVDDGDNRVGSEILTVEASDEGTIEIVDGDGQTGTVGEELDDELLAQAENDCGVPMAGIDMTWEGDNASPDPDTYTIEPDGTARTEVTLGNDPGDATVTARVGDATAEFEFDAEVGEPENVLIDQPEPTSYEVSETEGVELTFTAADHMFNPLDEGDFEFEVILLTPVEDGDGLVISDAVFEHNDESTATLQFEDGTTTATIINTTAERVFPVVEDTDSAAWVDLYEQDFDELEYRVDDTSVDAEKWSFWWPENFEIGEPTTGPGQAAVGDHVLATMLDEDYNEADFWSSIAMLHLEDLYPDPISVGLVDVEFTHYFEAPEDPHGEDCALALGLMAFGGTSLDIPAYYDGMPHCKNLEFSTDGWPDGFATTDESYETVEFTISTEDHGDELEPLYFGFMTSEDSAGNDYFFSGPGWYIDDLSVEILAATIYVDFEPGEMDDLAGEAEDGVAGEQEAVAEFTVTDEYGNPVEESGVEIHADLDPNEEMNGDAEITGIYDGQGSNFQSSGDGTEATAETDNNGVVALTIANDVAEEFVVDAEITAIDADTTVEGEFTDPE